MNFQTPGALQQVLDYAGNVKAKRLEVTGYRAAVRLTNGKIMTEREGIAEIRADQVARMFDGLLPGVENVQVGSLDHPELGSWQDRKVTITVYP